MNGDVFIQRLSGVPSALADHLWQSTLFALVAGLLTLILRQHPARHRYCLWLAASLKFLVPFSLLITIGAQFQGLPHTTRHTAQVYQVAQAVSRDLMGPSFNHGVRVTDQRASSSVLPISLAFLWLGGISAVLTNRCLRWRQVFSIVRQTKPLKAGREVEALRQIERHTDLRNPIEILLSPSPVEPGIFGVLRPVLLWPSEISAHLDDRELRSILAHEVCHVRRRDNLFSAVHMLVEALFWFHPLVWWLGARMIEERERACDQGALESGNDRIAYAEGILKTSAFCARPSLMCVSGVTGADLKNRIVRIMSAEQITRVPLHTKLLLMTAGVLVIALPISTGMLPASSVQLQRENMTIREPGSTPPPIQSTRPTSPVGTPGKAVRKTCKSARAKKQPNSNP